MRGSWLTVVVLAVVCGLSGCVSPGGNRLYNQMQRKAARINSSKGLAAVGVGKSKDLALAQKMATSRGRMEMAAILQARVNSLAKDFQEQIGPAESAEFNTLFSTAGKQITAQTIQGVAPKEIVNETKGDLITVYALMWQNPKVIKEYFANQKNTSAALYERFRASQAFKELDKDIQQYEEFLKKEGLPSGD